MAPVLLNPSRFGGGGGGSGYSAAVLALSPLWYPKLDETSGTTAVDSSGNSRNGTYTNTPTVGATSLLTDGSGHSMGIAADTGQCVSIASASWMNVSALTVSCLANLSSATDTGNGDAIMSRYTSAGYQWLLWRDTSGKWSCQLSESNGSTRTVTSTVTATLNTTYHLAMTYDGSALRLYVNGSASGTPFTGMSGFYASTAPIEIGRYSQANATTPGGFIDEPAMWGSALSAGNIATLAAAA